MEAQAQASPGGSRSRKTEERRRRRLNLVAIPVYLAAALLLVNQRVGWGDSGGPQLLAVILRSDIWIALALVVALLVAPRWSPSPEGFSRTYKRVFVYTPAVFLACMLMASVLSLLLRGQFADAFGFGDLVKIVMSTGLGLLVFKLSVSDDAFAPRVVKILMWTPLANIAVGIFALTTLTNNISGFNEVSDDGTLGAGFIGLGGRFQGLASNANIVMTQSGIGLSLLVAQLMRPPRTLAPGKKAVMSIYAVALCVIMAWTGVRAALIVWPTIFLVLLWLGLHPTAKSMVTTASVMLKFGGFFIAGWFAAEALGLQETLVERLDSEDGRLFLWSHYFGLLLENPLGMGLAFETIAGSESMIAGQRLPPHNALLQAGMYAGIGGVMTSLFLIWLVGSVIGRAKRSSRKARLSPELLGVILAWCALIASLMFAGLISGDFNFALLTGLLLSMAARRFEAMRHLSKDPLEFANPHILTGVEFGHALGGQAPRSRGARRPQTEQPPLPWK